MNNTRATRVTASVSIHRQIYSRVQAMARDESRTISNMISVLVKEGINARDAEAHAEPEEAEQGAEV